MKNKGLGHLKKTRLFTIKISKNVGFGGPVVNTLMQAKGYIKQVNFLTLTQIYGMNPGSKLQNAKECK